MTSVGQVCATCHGPFTSEAPSQANRRGDLVHAGGCPRKTDEQREADRKKRKVSSVQPVVRVKFEPPADARCFTCHGLLGDLPFRRNSQQQIVHRRCPRKTAEQRRVDAAAWREITARVDAGTGRR